MPEIEDNNIERPIICEELIVYTCMCDSFIILLLNYSDNSDRF